MRIVLLQLPVPDGSGTDIPLAAACLQNAWQRWFADRSAAESSLEDPCHFITPPDKLVNLGSDPAILEWLAAQSPDLVGFSLYLWNRERSCALARQAKSKSPDLRCIAGGPEVQDGEPIDPFDWLIVGPGEEAFVALLARLTGFTSPADESLVPKAQSLFLPRRQSKSAVLASLNPESAPLAHPWLDGSLPLSPDHPVYLETVRGCPNKCSYCFYGKQFKRLLFLPEALAETIVCRAAAAGSPELYLMDPSFSQRPDLENFLEKLAGWNTGGQLVVHAELRLEDITPRRAELLAAAGIRSVEAGLQSTNERALAAVGRHWDQAGFEQGARLLQAAGIQISTGVIIGLPEDGPADIRRTIDYVASLGLGSGAEAYPLAILPGTLLREQAAARGLEYLERPPYYLLSSPLLGQADIQEAIAYADERWEREGLAPIMPDPAHAVRISSAAQAESLLAEPARLPRVINLRLSAGLLADRKSLSRLMKAGQRWRTSSASSECRLLLDVDALPEIDQLEDLRSAFFAPDHLLERIRYYHPDAQGIWSCRLFGLISDPRLIEPWQAAGLDDHADLVIDLVDAKQPAELVRRVLAADWDQIPFLRVGSSSRPELASLYDGLENLLLD